ncbi:hypothetical protein ON010_g16812 [Phytophthora cinnamomi]|nr:hypothetical protein ON010_g16812 [Phytophthora cinnamomi]
MQPTGRHAEAPRVTDGLQLCGRVLVPAALPPTRTEALECRDDAGGEMQRWFCSGAAGPGEHFAAAEGGRVVKYPWYVHLLRFLRDAEYPPAIAEDMKYPASSSDAEKREEFYFDLSVAERVAILKFLCEIQFDRNDTLVEQIDQEEAESMRNEPIGTDAAGRSYFILEDAATVPNAAVWVCRCAKVGGTDWETVCNDLESVELLVQELSLSIDSADLQLWHALSRGALKKLTRQKEKRKRNERWKHELATSGVLDATGNFEGIGRRSLRNRRQVNYANIDEEEEEEEEEETIADSDKSGDEEEAFEAKSDDDAGSETDGDDDGDDEEDDDQPRRSTRNSVARKRKSPSRSIRSSKRRRQSPHEVSDDHPGLRRSSRNRGNPATTSSSQDEDDDSDDDDSDVN